MRQKGRGWQHTSDMGANKEFCGRVNVKRSESDGDGMKGSHCRMRRFEEMDGDDGIKEEIARKMTKMRQNTEVSGLQDHFTLISGWCNRDDVFINGLVK